MKDLEFPFDSNYIIKKKKAIKKELLSQTETSYIEKKIAILGGQTTQNILLTMELFLLNYGIKPIFYESEYNQFYEDGMFPNSKLEEFQPDIIYICTCIRNIKDFPCISDTEETVSDKLNGIKEYYYNFWDNVFSKYNCPIIQNNFEYPYFRLMGNSDCYDIHGRVNFVSRINFLFSEYAQKHSNFHICDVNYISASYGLDKWSDPYYWHMYKYAVAVPAIPYLSFNVSNIIKSIFGKNKKVLNIDLDNTLWGGIVGDDGAENIEIGQETSLAQTYSEFQEYVKLHKRLGILLTINSKNDESSAISGLQRPDSILSPEDFVNIKANWNPKNENLIKTAEELNLLAESFVFIDDNPAERSIVSSTISGVAVPEIGNVENYIRCIDRSGFFEVTSISDDDIKRNAMYIENHQRQQFQSSFVDYETYLKSLEMKGEIKEFVPQYLSRIAQLTNKSNQFNLTTRRYSQSEIENVSKDSKYLTLYGKLTDRFGDNGVVSIIIGQVEGHEVHLELWLMSCRVLKRNMEFAMMDALVHRAKELSIKSLVGYYYPTEKNVMVKDFYKVMGFERVSEDDQGNTVWNYNIPDIYENKQNIIDVS